MTEHIQESRINNFWSSSIIFGYCKFFQDIDISQYKYRATIRPLGNLMLMFPEEEWSLESFPQIVASVDETLLTVALLIGASVATHSGHVVKPAAATSYPHLPAPVYSYPPPPTPADLAAAYRLYTLKYGYAPAALPPAPMGYAPVTYAAPLPPAYWPAYAPLPSPAAHAHHFIDQHFDYAHKHAHHHHH
ncbi:hypothetical protein AVEN_208900-1 [Araneus ventricosus]|uniref:Uncharacterized protein n=1 Tax=Araneus ventricosus TaxID=182803 RepID=A0A4Y2EZR9_ARAVE|nr:hypothetical protein AVEN_208900-1 [Araneus ventricosus]